MAHKLNFNKQTGKHALMSVKEKAWHGLGQVIDRYPTSSEAIQYAGLNYTVEKRPLFTLDKGNPDGQPKIGVPDYFATVRTDTGQVLGVVGNDYEVVQNKDAFSFFDAIVGGGDGILYETAGALGIGERIFITAKLPDSIRVGREDLIEQYLFLTTTHNGFGSIFAAFTPVRIVCNNTLNAAYRNHTNAIKIRHTASAAERLKMAHELMGISRQQGDELSAIFNYWSKVRIKDKEVLKLIQIAMAPDKETLQDLKDQKLDRLSSRYINVVSEVYAYGMGNSTQQLETTSGTLFGAYNAVTGYFQNVRDYKDQQAKFKSVFEGTAKQRSQIAFNLCDAFARKGAEALLLN